MGKIVISTNATLDGVVQDPDGQEQSKFGGWFKQFGGDDLEPPLRRRRYASRRRRGWSGVPTRREGRSYPLTRVALRLVALL